MKPYIILMLFAVVGLFSGTTEARLFRSRVMVRQSQKSVVRVERQPVRKLIPVMPAMRGSCANGQCSR